MLTLSFSTSYLNYSDLIASQKVRFLMYRKRCIPSHLINRWNAEMGFLFFLRVWFQKGETLFYIVLGPSLINIIYSREFLYCSFLHTPLDSGADSGFFPKRTGFSGPPLKKCRRGQVQMFLIISTFKVIFYVFQRLFRLFWYFYC